MRMSRRRAVQAGALAALAAGGTALTACAGGRDSRRGEDVKKAAYDMTGIPEGLRMPEETHPHTRTYMAWPTRRVWKSYTSAVRQDIAGIARAVAEFEPVTLLANERNVAAARRACGSGVEVVSTPVDDLWMRDTGPAFVLGGPDGLAGVDLNFNGWGDKQTHTRDARVAREILKQQGVRRYAAPIVAEGGSIEVDGQGTLLATESSLLNDNRNPGRTREEIEEVLGRLLGVRKVIWVKGLKGQDITDYHIDSLARFAAPGVVVMNTPAPGAPRDMWFTAYEQAREVLRTATDARGRRLEIVDLPEPVDIGRRGDDFLATYVNYYVVNDGVVLPRFGDRKADDRAASVVRELYPGREVVQVPVDALGEGGGGIHCSTQQQPKAK